LDSKWCHAEVGAFWGSGKPIIIYPAEPKCDVPPYLAGIRRAKSIDEVLDAIRRVMETAPATPVWAQDPLSATLAMSGLTHAFRIPTDNSPRLDRVCELTDQEAKGHGQLRLVASSGYSYLNPLGLVWKARLGELITRGVVEMSVVLESPFSHFAVTRAVANKVDRHHWQEKQRPENLIELLQYPNISVRVTDASVNCSLFFTSQAVYYDPYLWALPHPASRTENNFWVFEFDKVSDPRYDCYTLLEKHFEFLHRYSVPLEEVLHTPEEGSTLPRGKEFYDLYRENSDVALNRYEALTKEFQQKVRTLLKGE